mmetsp:Transcript_18075/g.30845  ORF Transcript_18075/g.30845 Transcript_18075/m.30845 type:complete len:188 (+) Transcript_18075:576-1139(+)
MLDEEDSNGKNEVGEGCICEELVQDTNFMQFSRLILLLFKGGFCPGQEVEEAESQSIYLLTWVLLNLTSRKDTSFLAKHLFGQSKGSVSLVKHLNLLLRFDDFEGFFSHRSNQKYLANVIWTLSNLVCELQQVSEESLPHFIPERTLYVHEAILLKSSILPLLNSIVFSSKPWGHASQSFSAESEMN